MKRPAAKPARDRRRPQRPAAVGRGPRRPQRTDRPQSPPADPAAARAGRQTTAYLKKLFAAVGFSIDARRGQNFLVDLNLLDLLER